MTVIELPLARNGQAIGPRGRYFAPGNLPAASARPQPRLILEEAIALNGPRKVLIAALAALVRPRARPPDLRHLPNHVRADIGLGPAPPPLPSQRHLF
ncbi:MAG: hypothetical protein AAFY65_06140 [Pseudomonadota bacterium]